MSGVGKQLGKDQGAANWVAWSEPPQLSGLILRLHCAGYVQRECFLFLEKPLLTGSPGDCGELRSRNIQPCHNSELSVCLEALPQKTEGGTLTIFSSAVVILPA